MGIYAEYGLDPDVWLSVWKIEETHQELMQKLRPAVLNGEYAALHHPHKQLQWLASRVLLQHMLGGENDFLDGPIHKTIAGKPLVLSNGMHLSISHSGPWVAVMLGGANCGVDIEVKHGERMGRLWPKFIGPQEAMLLGIDGGRGYDFDALHAYWVSKEAAYKWQGDKQISLKHHIHILESVAGEESGILPVEVLSSSTSNTLNVNYLSAPDYSLAWVMK